MANSDDLVTEWGVQPETAGFLAKRMVEMALTGKRQWYIFFKPVFCWLGLHEWVKIKYRKKDRTLIVWEECLICRKVKED